jgi:RHS repeat-associated protein
MPMATGLNNGYQIGTNNQLLADGQFTYEYDHEGNRTKRTEAATGKVTEYVWDYHNRLTGVVFKDAAGVVLKNIEYIYDVNNQRIGKKIDGVVTERYVLDRNQIALVFDGQGVQKSRYLYGTQVDQVLAEESGTQVRWFLADHQGTIKDVVDNAGTVIDHITYDSFGRIVGQTNPIDLRFAYTGREWDGETGQYYYRARYYDPADGRFISEDPVGFIGGDSNLSRYVGNSPTNFIDPSDLKQTMIEGEIVRNAGYNTGAGANNIVPISRGGGTGGGGSFGGSGSVGSGYRPSTLQPVQPQPFRPLQTGPIPNNTSDGLLRKRPTTPEEYGPLPRPVPPVTRPTPSPDPNCPKIEEEIKPCKFSIDEQHLFHPDTRSGRLSGFHSTSRTLEGIDYSWDVPPNFDAEFEPFEAYFSIPNQPQLGSKFSTFFPIKATDFAVLEAIGEAYIKSDCQPNGAWSAAVKNPVTGQSMGVQGTVLNHFILTAFPSV